MWYWGPWEIFLCWFAAQVCPWGIRQAINWATREYGAPDIYITENGFRWPLNACPGGKTVVVYWQHSVLVGGWVGGWVDKNSWLPFTCFVAATVLGTLMIFRGFTTTSIISTRKVFFLKSFFLHYIDNINQYIFWEHYLNYTLKTQGLYFKSRCWRQSKWTGSL